MRVFHSSFKWQQVSMTLLNILDYLNYSDFQLFRSSFQSFDERSKLKVTSQSLVSKQRSDLHGLNSSSEPHCPVRNIAERKELDLKEKKREGEYIYIYIYIYTRCIR